MTMNDAGQARLARLVRERRDQAGITQEELAELAGVHKKTITNLEAPTRASRRRPKTWPQIAKALRWHEDSYAEVMAGRDPRVIAEPPPGAALDPVERAIISSALSADDVISLLEHYRAMRAKLSRRGTQESDPSSTTA